MTLTDCDVLRELGQRLASIAAEPVHAETRSAWKALNGLKPTRPMFMIDQICWNEMNVDDELTCRCEDPFSRGIETVLRQRIYQWEHMPDDKVVEPVVEIPKVIRDTGTGITVDEDVAVFDTANDVVGHHYHDQIRTEADLDKIRTPEVTLDSAATAEAEEKAHEIFDGVLEVRMQGLKPHYAMWDQIVTWRSPEAVLFDLVDRPDFIHELCRRTTDARMVWLDQVEAQGLLCTHLADVHCTGAFSDEIPADGADPERTRTIDLWTFGMSQIFSTVSPEMHEEFERPYLGPWFERFGLAYYGCCEPLDRKIDMIRRLPKVRKISMSPWVDVENGARQIRSDFVFSRKPSPAFLAVDDWDPAAVEEDLRKTLDTCRDYGCPCELILKDISTVHYEPQRLWQWSTMGAVMVRKKHTKVKLCFCQ